MQLVSDLKNCPFIQCNGEAKITPEGDYHEVSCLECGCSVQAHTYKEAQDLWNTREPQLSVEEGEAMVLLLKILGHNILSCGWTPTAIRSYYNAIAIVRKMVEGE